MNSSSLRVRQVPRKSAILCITALKESWRRSEYPAIKREAVQLTKSDYDRYDYIIAMDEMNIRNIMRIIRSDPENKVSLLLSHAGIGRKHCGSRGTRGTLTDTYRDVLLGCKGLFREVTGE